MAQFVQCKPYQHVFCDMTLFYSRLDKTEVQIKAKCRDLEFIRE